MVSINQEFSRRHRAASGNACSNNYKAIGIGIEKPRDDSVILVGSRVLVGAVDHPILLCRIISILNPEAGHFLIVGEMETQWSRQAQSPAIIVGTNENRGTASQIAQRGGRFPLYAIASSVRMEEPGDIDQWIDIVNDHRDHAVGKSGLPLRIAGVA